MNAPLWIAVQGDRCVHLVRESEPIRADGTTLARCGVPVLPANRLTRAVDVSERCADCWKPGAP